MDFIKDAATVTGAAVMAVGRNYHAIFSPQRELLALTQSKSAEMAERVWPLAIHWLFPCLELCHFTTCWILHFEVT